jgi:hypothetical protein
LNCHELKLCIINFKKLLCSKFWISVKKEFPELSKRGKLSLLPFTSTHFCETAFSAITAIKTKQHSRLHVEANFIVAISSVSPRMGSIMSKIPRHTESSDSNNETGDKQEFHCRSKLCNRQVTSVASGWCDVKWLIKI